MSRPRIYWYSCIPSCDDAQQNLDTGEGGRGREGGGEEEEGERERGREGGKEGGRKGGRKKRRKEGEKKGGRDNSRRESRKRREGEKILNMANSLIQVREGVQCTEQEVNDCTNCRAYGRRCLSLRISLLLVVAASLQNTARTLRDCGGLGGWKGGREKGREGGKEGGKEGRREGEREGGKEGRREGGKEKGREEGREGRRKMVRTRRQKEASRETTMRYMYMY